MVRVMIVEDEPHILRSIKRMIESLHPQFEVVATAYNGEEAVKLLPIAEPDILFTDINMPIMGGLELLAYVKKQGLDIEPIIISGYQEFEYARKALSLGVNEYLLKPISRGDLSALLEQLFIHYERKQKQKEMKYLGSLLLHQQAAEPFPSMIFHNETKFTILLHCSGSFPSYSTSDDSLRYNYWYELDLEKACGDFIGNELNGVWVLEGKSEAEKFIVLAGEGISFKFGVDSFVSNLTLLFSTSELPITTVISPMIENVRDIGVMSRMLRSMMSKHIRIGYSQTLQASELQVKQLDPYSGLNSYTERSLTVALEQGNIQLFKLVIKETIDQWKSIYPTQLEIEKMLKQIVSICQKHRSAKESYIKDYLESDIEQAIYNVSNYDQLLRYLYCIIELVFNIQKQKNLDEQPRKLLVEEITEFIQANYTEPINHQTLAEKFGLVPSYISKLFNQQKGCSPGKYLINIRIDKAKELMRVSPELKIWNIAEIVGYSDPQYFSRIFKKETGKYPSEYIESLKY